MVDEHDCCMLSEKTNLAMYILEQAIGVSPKLQLDISALRSPASHELVHASLECKVYDHAGGRQVLNVVNSGDLMTQPRLQQVV